MVHPINQFDFHPPLINLEEEKSQPKKKRTLYIMCGRFVVFSNLEHLQEYFSMGKALSEVTPNYNVAPAQEILTIFQQEGLNMLEKMHWGLVPHWAKDVSAGYKMINARSETIATKPSFRDAFKKRRCLIPANGFYEWSGPRGNKQPVFITLPDEKPFAFAGLWETWHDKDQDAPYRSCTIITREAGPCLKGLHDRMPAILHPDIYDAWLDQRNQDGRGLQEILAERTITEFKFRPVSRQVNSVKINDPSNIAGIPISIK
jgi:putative SOS response-associated peptidase YedK